MKILSQFLVVLMLSVLSTAFAKNTNNPADVEAVKQVIQDYVKETDTRNVDALEKTLYSNGSYYSFNKVTNKASEMTNDQFLDQVKQGQTGGWERKLNINSVDVNDNTAIAKVEISDAKLKQSGYLTLVKADGIWKIMSGAYTLETIK